MSTRFIFRPRVVRDAKPNPDQLGTLREQLDCIALFLANPYRTIDRDAAWQVARRLVLDHARRTAA